MKKPSRRVLSKSHLTRIACVLNVGAGCASRPLASSAVQPVTSCHISREHDWSQIPSASAGWSVTRQVALKPVTDVVPSRLEVSLRGSLGHRDHCGESGKGNAAEALPCLLQPVLLAGLCLRLLGSPFTSSQPHGSCPRRALQGLQPRGTPSPHSTGRQWPTCRILNSLGSCFRELEGGDRAPLPVGFPGVACLRLHRKALSQLTSLRNRRVSAFVLKQAPESLSPAPSSSALCGAASSGLGLGRAGVWPQASCSLLFGSPDSFGSCTADRLSFSGFACCFLDYFVETGVCVADPLTALPGWCHALPGAAAESRPTGSCSPARVFTGFVCCLY